MDFLHPSGLPYSMLARNSVVADLDDVCVTTGGAGNEGDGPACWPFGHNRSRSEHSLSRSEQSFFKTRAFLFKTGAFLFKNIATSVQDCAGFGGKVSGFCRFL